MGKINGNNVNIGDYYIGLDVGTNSVGWAVTDEEYNICKFKGNAMWGARLFEEANDASARRINRENRRRLNRRKQRLLILEMLFAEEINKVDNNFFIRLEESSLWEEDKSIGSKYSLFNDPNFTDKEYFKQYPTIYHLRHELATSCEPHDVRLVFLALHHIIKSRGHFLYEISDDNNIISSKEALNKLSLYIEDNYGDKFVLNNMDKFSEILSNSELGINQKKKELKAIGFAYESENINFATIIDSLSGATIKLSDLFYNEELKNAEIKSISLKDNIDEEFDLLCSILNENVELILQLKMVYDAARLSQILSGHKYICDAKIDLFEKNKKDLACLKAYVRSNTPDKYKQIFCEKKSTLNNYPAYSRYNSYSGEYFCTQEDFCKFLKTTISEPSEDNNQMCKIYREIQEGTFLTKLRGTDNGLIPYQLHRQELIKILDNAATYLGFLNEKDTDGISIKEKIVKTFEFRIPYYVGPLTHAVRFSKNENEKVLPWNFDKIVDTEKCAEKFIENLIGRCPYTGEKVLPKDSLLYREYMLLNEINSLKVNGHSLPIEVKQQLIEDLFHNSQKKVTKKSIKSYLISKGMIEESDEISGVDDVIKTRLTSWHDFREILERIGDFSMVENIIRATLIFGEDKTMLRKWLKNPANTSGLTENDIKHICRLKYSDWGRLSSTLLLDIKSEVNGKNLSIFEMLQTTNLNLMQILSSEYGFMEKAEEYRNELIGINQTLYEKLDDLYIAPAVRRSIRQTLKIVDELVDIKKSAPKKIFIEMARDSSKELKGKRTESRKDKLIYLYRASKEESNELFTKLQNEDENHLRSDKLYLYYSQLGKCMYSGEEIDLEALLNGEKYDIDHIFPRSKVKDNSIDNRVLVKNNLNREKTNEYPIKENIRKNMFEFWALLKSRNLISEKKYDRLIRSYPLTEKELSDFVARQLTETQQATKALATLLKDEYKNTKIVYSKAGNVSDFRQEYDIIKCREINDLHHAKDAYLNIVVGNVYCTKFTDKFFSNILNENYSLNRVFETNTKGAWDKDNSIKTVKKQVFKSNAIVTRMPHEAKGQLYDLNIMPAGKGQLEKKAGLEIAKYGGYNKLTGAYFFVAEYSEKGKRVRSILPVYLYKKALYESSPIAYCEDILGLVKPVIIAKKIATDTLLEVNNTRMYISGRTGSSLVCKHAYQLAAEYDIEKYIKALAKYVDRCTLAKRELPLTQFDKISMEKNINLYRWFINKSKSSVFNVIHKNMVKDLVDNQQEFESKDILVQSKLLLEILKAYQSNAANPNLESLNGKKTVARIVINSKITGNFSTFIINQSVTGLYEYKKNILN